MSEMNDNFEGYEEECEDVEFVEADEIFGDSSSEQSLEITFKVKKDFARLFTAISNTHGQLMLSDGAAAPSLKELVDCIDLQSKCVAKGKLYNIIYVRFEEELVKKAKKVAKKCLGELLRGSKDATWQYIYNKNMWDSQINITQILEKAGKMYCRIDIGDDSILRPASLEMVGEVIGNFAEEITDAVKICNGVIRCYEPLDFKVSDGCLKVHGILENDVNIKLVDKTKVYMVKANIMIPETIKNVIKQVDKIDQVIESVKPSNDESRLRSIYDKLVYDYDTTCAFLRDHHYGSELIGYRQYEKERLFKEFSDNIKKIIAEEDTLYIMYNYDDTSKKGVSLASSLLQTEENRFSDDYKHWIFSGTFTNIDREFLETAFADLKKNVQSLGVPEQYIDIRVAEIQ